MARPVQNPQNRINQILDAADMLFFTQGYHATTISDIAKKMGAAQGLMYYYFKSKEEVLERLLDRHTAVLVSEVSDIFNSTKEPIDKFSLSISAIFAMINYKDGFLLSMIYDRQNLHIKDKLFQHLESVLSFWLAKIIEEGIEKGLFHTLDVATAIEFILTIVEALCIVMQRKESIDKMPFRLEMAEMLFSKMLGVQENTIHVRLS